MNISSAYKKGLKKLQRGGANAVALKKLDSYIKLLASGEHLPAQSVDHQLDGRMKDYRASKIDNNLRVIYFVEGNTLHLLAIGTHEEVYESV